jgi:CheY-like chemotaxis protein
MLSLATVKVLVVDDSNAVRMMLTVLLRTFGINEIEASASGAQALQLIEKIKFDLVITDVSMEPMDGIELTRRIRSPGKLGQPSLPVLILSSHSETEVVRAAIEAGSSDYLTKPINRAALLAKIVSLLGRPRAVVRNDNYWGPDRRKYRTSKTGRKRRLQDLN